MLFNITPWSAGDFIPVEPDQNDVISLSFHHSIYMSFVCFPWWSIDELENLQADRTTNYIFWAIAEAEGEVGYP